MSDADLARSLLTPRAVRERSQAMLALCERDELIHWRLDRTKLPAVADYVLETIRANYPALDIPFHARWRHFVVHDNDLWAAFKGETAVDTGVFKDRADQARCAFDLAIVSVLLDAGAGADWRFESRTGPVLRRSEGLAVASLEMFEDGVFSNTARDPYRADARALTELTAATLAQGFKVSASNPLEGLDGRAALLNGLGRAVAARPGIFGRHDGLRPGGLYDHFAYTARGAPLPAAKILEALLEFFGPLWPSRLTLGGIALGDAWQHPALVTDDATTGIVPFHKLSQWLAYSLIEPLQDAGIAVVDVDALTGLPEYRNGGLFVDLGALVLKDPSQAAQAHAPSSHLVVEWRALTVALLDDVAARLRATLHLDAQALPLAKVLEGGTWAAGRRVAKEKRADGTPPITIVSDGTVF